MAGAWDATTPGWGGGSAPRRVHSSRWRCPIRLGGPQTTTGSCTASPARPCGCNRRCRSGRGDRNRIPCSRRRSRRGSRRQGVTRAGPFDFAQDLRGTRLQRPAGAVVSAEMVAGAGAGGWSGSNRGASSGMAGGTPGGNGNAGLTAVGGDCPKWGGMSKICIRLKHCAPSGYLDFGPSGEPQDWTVLPQSFETYGRSSGRGWGRGNLAGRLEKCRATARSGERKRHGWLRRTGHNGSAEAGCRSADLSVG